MIFTFLGEPIPKGRPRFTGKGHVYTPRRVKDAEESIRWQLKAEHVQPTSELLELRLFFRSKYGPYDVRGADIDNLEKLIFDAGTGYLWVNDRQIKKVTSEIANGVKDPSTRLEVIELGAMRRAA